MNNPPAGWYQNPQGEGQRYWDGTTWTDQFRGPKDWYRARPNEHAVGSAVLFGAVSYIGLLASLNPRIGGSSAYGAGQLLVPAAIATAAVALAARGTTHHLRWWVYALAVPAVAAGFALLVTADDLRESREAAESRGDRIGVLSVPAAGEGWTVVDTPETRTEVQRISDGIADEAGGDIDSVVAQFYTHSSAPNSPVLFVGLNGALDNDRSANEAVDDMLAGASVENPEDFDPGDVGGALECGEGAAQGLEWIACAWIGDERAVFLRWNDNAIGLGRAAELTRVLRERASRT